MRYLPAVLSIFLSTAPAAVWAQVSAHEDASPPGFVALPVRSIAPSATALLLPLPGFSSSAEDEPWPVADESHLEAPSGFFLGNRYPKPELAVIPNTTPFSAYALALKLGTGGIGFDVATPLTSKINLRAGASFFSYTTSFVTDDVPINGTLHLANVEAVVDWFPFKGPFHISPGLTLYNNTNYNARIFIAGGQIITLNDQDYTSDPADPIRGTAFINLGSTVAPRLTAGFGNMIPHRDKNWTFPVEIGIQYIPAPTAVFVLTGSSCQSATDCGPIQNDPSTQANILAQQKEITNDIAPLRFFPVVSFGVSYKFGH